MKNAIVHILPVALENRDIGQLRKNLHATIELEPTTMPPTCVQCGLSKSGVHSLRERLTYRDKDQ